VSREHAQDDYRVRFDWGLAGARALTDRAKPGDVAVVVDVLSFTTTLAVALDAGVVVHPYPWAEPGAAAYAEKRGAVLAVGRRAAAAASTASTTSAAEPGRVAVSLSPASFAGVTGVDRVVLPSPNGSAISFALRDAGVVVVGACLRNAAAVGDWLRSVDGCVSVVAAGERWPDGQLRPAVEDLWGAGAVLAALGLGDASPEARAAAAAFREAESQLAARLPETASGRELAAAGYGRDVELAAQAAVSDVVPVLRGDAFVDRA
jgi:2-phosphosulfolactate phosphatase